MDHESPSISEHHELRFSVPSSKSDALDFFVTLCHSHDVKEISLKCVSIIVLAVYEIYGLAIMFLKNNASVFHNEGTIRENWIINRHLADVMEKLIWCYL